MPEPTGRYGWTVPEGTDSPSGPEQFTELANDIAVTVGDIDDRVHTSFVTYTPTWAGLTVGNGVPVMRYRLLGTHAVVYLQVAAAASAPTTAFLNSLCSFTAPFTPQARATGLMYYEVAGQAKAGMIYSMAGSMTMIVGALRQTDLSYQFPGAVWGTTAWTPNSYIFGSIIIPI